MRRRKDCRRCAGDLRAALASAVAAIKASAGGKSTCGTIYRKWHMAHLLQTCMVCIAPRNQQADADSFNHWPWPFSCLGGMPIGAIRSITEAWTFLQARTKQSVRPLLALGTPASCSHSRARVLDAQLSLPIANSTCVLKLLCACTLTPLLISANPATNLKPCPDNQQCMLCCVHTQLQLVTETAVYQIFVMKPCMVHAYKKVLRCLGLSTSNCTWQHARL